MSRQRVLATVGLFAAVFGGVMLWVLPRAASPRPLSDAELAALRGRQYGLWCWPVASCQSTSQGSCPGGTLFCEGNMQDGECFFTSNSYYGEACQPNYGNEICSSDPPLITILCYERFSCRCTGTPLVCSNQIRTSVECEAVNSDVGCVYEPCPI